MRRGLPDGSELDDDPSRIDEEVVVGYLSTEAYWGRERTPEEMRRMIREADRVVGLFHEGRQIGFTRTVADGRQAYLADVFVLPEHRGRGLGMELVRETVESGPFRECRWILYTKDAHGLYARFGFVPPSDRVLERPPVDGR